MPNLYPLIRPILRRLPSEAAHDLTISALAAGWGRLMTDRAAREPDPPILAQRLWGLDFTNPLGLAAGFDKDARVADAMRSQTLPVLTRIAIEGQPTATIYRAR